MSAEEPTEEQLREALKQMKVEDLILQSVVTLVNLTGQKLTAEGAKDTEQARKGIEAIRALLPHCPQEELGPVKDAVSQLQMIYVRETGGGPGGEAPPEPAAEPEQPQQQAPSSRIWTPPGS